MSKRNQLLEDKLRKLLTVASAAPWRPLLAERVHLRLCNRLCAIGIHDAMAELEFLFDNVATVGADFLEICSLPLGALVETDLTPRCGAIDHLLVPCAMIIHQDKTGGLVDVRVYFDPGPIFTRPHSASPPGARAKMAKPSRSS